MCTFTFGLNSSLLDYGVIVLRTSLLPSCYCSSVKIIDQKELQNFDMF